MDLPLTIADIAARLEQYRDGTLPMVDAARDIEWLLSQAHLAEKCGRKVVALQSEVDLLNEAIEAYESDRRSDSRVREALAGMASRWETTAIGRKKFLREDDIADTMLACASEVRKL